VAARVDHANAVLVMRMAREAARRLGRHGVDVAHVGGVKTDRIVRDGFRGGHVAASCEPQARPDPRIKPEFGAPGNWRRNVKEWRTKFASVPTQTEALCAVERFLSGRASHPDAMNRHLSAAAPNTQRRALCAALGTAGLLLACTPLRVVTHSVSPAEAAVPGGRYMLDAHHWSIVFDVDHLHYTRFVMRFDRASAQLDWRAHALEDAAVEVVIDATSLDTNVPLLDRMVKGAQMLDVERYAQIHFVSTRFERTGEVEGKPAGKLKGDLTIRGVTQPVTLDVVFNGYAPNPLTKQPTLGFAAKGTFSRAKFGLTTWYPAVGDEIDVRIQAEFEHAPPPAADAAAQPQL
jgi:polyisoprenoid-binding protein YceI